MGKKTSSFYQLQLLRPLRLSSKKHIEYINNTGCYIEFFFYFSTSYSRTEQNVSKIHN